MMFACTGTNCKKKKECYCFIKNVRARSRDNYYLEDFSLIHTGCFNIELEHDYDCGDFGDYKLFKQTNVKPPEEEIIDDSDWLKEVED